MRRKQALEAAGWICELRLVCDGATADEVDHIVPLSEGGEPYKSTNTRAVCRDCHRERHRRDQEAV